MRKLFFILLFCPFVIYAQTDETIDLKQGNCACTIINKTASTVSSIEPDEDNGMAVTKVKFENDSKLEIITLKKPMTIKMVKNSFAQVLKTKNKSVELKAIINTPNELLLERKYKSDGRVIYKSMYLIAIKGKEYMIESSEEKTLEEAKALLQTAKTIKFN